MSPRTTCLAALATVLSLPLTSSAQTYTWDGESANSSNWNQPFNWVGNSNPTSGQDVGIVFAGITRLNPNQDLANPFELNQLSFTNSAGAFALTGSPLLFRRNSSTSHPDLFQNSSSTITIANEIRIEANAYLFAQGSGSGGVYLNGPIVGGANTSIQKNDDFFLVLDNANNTTWTGFLAASQGIVYTTSAGAINGVDVVVSRGGQLNTFGYSQTIGSLSLSNFTNDGSATGPRVYTGAGTLSLGGNVNYSPLASGSSPFALISGNLNLGTTGFRTFNIGNPTSNAIEFITDADIAGGTGGINKTGTGTWLARSGVWSFSGTTFINGGAINTGAINVLSSSSTVSIGSDGQLGIGYNPGSGSIYFDQRIGGLASSSTTAKVSIGNATLTIGQNNDSTTYAGTITGVGGKVVKVGSGTLTLTGIGNTFSGGLEIRQGTVAVPSWQSYGGESAPLTVLAGGQFRFTGSTNPIRTFDLSAGGALSADSGTTVLYGGSRIYGGFLRGLGTHSFSSTTVVDGAVVLPGTNVSLTGTPTISNVTLGGNLTASGTGTKSLDGGSLTSSGTVLVNNSAVLAVNQWASNGVINVAGGVTPGRLNNTLNPLVLGGGSRTYVGSVAQRGGTIHLGGQNLELNGGLLVNNGDFIALNNGGIQGGTVNVNYGSLAKGTGYYQEVNVTDGGKFAPGNSITNTTSGTLTLNSGSTYEFEINRANGTAGGGGTTPPVGWDLLNLVAAFNVNSTAGSPAIIQLVSRNAADTGAGTLPDFDPALTYSWLAFRVLPGGTVNGFVADKFVMDTTAFANLPNPSGVGTFAMAQVGNDVFVNYSPVPEPGSVLLGLVAGALALGRVSRIRRKSAR
jgi:fibronectin-binding autotransporter adhesin